MPRTPRTLAPIDPARPPPLPSPRLADVKQLVINRYGQWEDRLPFDHAPHLWREGLAASSFEVHAICGALDAICDGHRAAAWLGETLGERLTSLAVLQQHGHSLPYEFPDECCELLLERLG